MTVKNYPDYKDSGSAWLGRVPSDWSTAPIKHLVSFNDEVISESTDDSTVIRYVEISDVDEVEGIKSSTEIKFGEAPSRARRLMREGDVLVSTVRTYLRAVASVSEEHDGSVGSTGFAVLRSRKLVPAHLAYLARAGFFIEEVIARSVGVSYPAINASDLVRVTVPVPSPDEQESIADYLDAQTAKIDTLIGKQERLIETLAERRQAVISHTVTKGLDPSAPTKNSGVDWIGAIPVAWSIDKLSRRFVARKGANAAQLTHEYCASVPGEFPVYSGQTENDGIMARIDSYEFDAGAEGVLFSTTVGSARVMTLRQIFGRFSLSQNCMIITRKGGLVLRFYFYFLRALFEARRGELAAHMQASFRMSDLYGYRVLVPSIRDQKAIAEYLDHETSKMDALSAKAREMINILKERRQALISAAVTGKIDVRGLA